MVAGRTVLVAVVIAVLTAGAQAAPDDSAALLDGAHPAVRRALGAADARPARVALGRLLERGRIDRRHLERALAMPEFGPFAVATLVALARVDSVEGMPAAFERLFAGNQLSNIGGAALEIQVAAAFGAEQVAAIGTMVDGNEVDVLLADGTRVEVKSFAGAADPPELRAATAKAIEQLRKRAAFGDDVILVTVRRLDAPSIADFRRSLGPTASAFVLEGGALHEQIARGPESFVRKLRRRSLGKARKTAFAARHRSRAIYRRAARRLRHVRPVRARR